MANVSFRRGTTAEIDAMPNVDGQLLFDTTENKILMDDGVNRLQYGGDTEVDEDLDDTSENPVQNKVIKDALDEKLNIDDVIDDLATASAVVADNVPVGCKAVAQLNNNLTANSNPFRFGYDAQSQKYGYILKEAGTDVFVPFNSTNDVIYYDYAIFTTKNPLYVYQEKCIGEHKYYVVLCADDVASYATLSVINDISIKYDIYTENGTGDSSPRYQHLYFLECTGDNPAFRLDMSGVCRLFYGLNNTPISYTVSSPPRNTSLNLWNNTYMNLGHHEYYLIKGNPDRNYYDFSAVSDCEIRKYTYGSGGSQPYKTVYCLVHVTGENPTISNNGSYRAIIGL